MAKKDKIPLEALVSQQTRQMGIENWGIENQGKIYNSKVLILGAGIEGQLTLGCLAGLGVGNIVIMDNRRSSARERELMFPESPYNGLKKSAKIEDISRKINENIEISCIHSKFSETILKFLDFTPDIIIDTNKIALEKEEVIEYASRNNKRLISASCTYNKAIVYLMDEKGKNIDEILDRQNIGDPDSRGIVTSGIAAGIVTDEVRKILFQLNENDNSLESRFSYNLESSDRNGFKEESIIKKVDENTKILIGGAGAIGNYVALGLALSGFKNVDILDFDRIEEHNLARQILLYDSAGKEKARILSKRIRELGAVNAEAVTERLDENSVGMIKRKEYGMVFGCFDNQEARYNLSNIALDLEIPYIDGGTSPTTGTVSFYYPGKTACIKCKRNLIKSEKRTSCQMALPSVVIPNVITGSVMVGEALHLLSGNISDHRIVFDSFDERRIHTEKEMGAKSSCKCYKK